MVAVWYILVGALWVGLWMSVIMQATDTDPNTEWKYALMTTYCGALLAMPFIQQAVKTWLAN